MNIMQILYGFLKTVPHADRFKIASLIMLYGLPALLLVFCILYLLVRWIKNALDGGNPSGREELAEAANEVVRSGSAPEDFGQTAAVIAAAITALRGGDGGFRIVSVNKKNKHREGEPLK